MLPSPRDRAGLVVAFARGNLPHPQDTCRDTEGCTDTPAHKSTRHGSLLRANVTVYRARRPLLLLLQSDPAGWNEAWQTQDPAVSPNFDPRHHVSVARNPHDSTTQHSTPAVHKGHSPAAGRERRRVVGNLPRRTQHTVCMRLVGPGGPGKVEARRSDRDCAVCQHCAGVPRVEAVAIPIDQPAAGRRVAQQKSRRDDRRLILGAPPGPWSSGWSSGPGSALFLSCPFRRAARAQCGRSAAVRWCGGTGHSPGRSGWGENKIK